MTMCRAMFFSRVLLGDELILYFPLQKVFYDYYMRPGSNQGFM